MGEYATVKRQDSQFAIEKILGREVCGTCMYGVDTITHGFVGSIGCVAQLRKLGLCAGIAEVGVSVYCLLVIVIIKGLAPIVLKAFLGDGVGGIRYRIDDEFRIDSIFQRNRFSRLDLFTKSCVRSVSQPEKTR